MVVPSDDSGATGTPPEPSGNTSGDGAAPAPAGAPTGNTDGGSGNKEAIKALQATIKTLESDNKGLKSQIRGVSNERNTERAAAKTMEQRVAELEETARTSQQRAVAAETKDRHRTALDTVIATVPEGRRKAARAIARGLSLDHEIGTEDNAAATDALAEQLKADHPDLFAEPKAQGRQTLPHIPGPSNTSGTEVVHLGVANAKGRRVM